MNLVESANLQTRKKISKNIRMNGNVQQQQVGIGAGRMEGQGADKAHEAGVPRPTGPDLDEGQVVCVDDDFKVAEVGGPLEKGCDDGKEFPEINVEGLGGGREPWCGVEVSEGE